MKYHDMKKPLLQSALVVLAILVVIGFVAGSGADTFFGGIISIIKGVIYTILFAFALIIGLIFSVFLLIAIFLGGVSVYSPEKAKEMYANVRQRSTDLYLSWTCQSARPQKSAASSFGQKKTVHSDLSGEEKPQFATVASLINLEQKISSELSGMKQTIVTLNAKNGSLDTSFATLQDSVSSLPGSEIIQRIDKLENQQEKLVAKLDESLQKFDKMPTNTAASEEENKRLFQELSTVQGEIAVVTKGLEELRASFSQIDNSSEKLAESSSEEESRIFSYLEKDADKKQFAKYITEAIEKNMTYAEIDVFLSKSLPKKLYIIIKEHPSLTKEYIRECKSR